MISPRTAGYLRRKRASAVTAAAVPLLLGGMTGTLVGRRGMADSTPLAPAAKAATATVDAGKTYQTLEGFGAATAYYQNWISAHPNKKALYDAFFKDLNLSILRLQNVYRPAKGADFAKDDADIVKGATASLGHPIRILMSSWSPPADLKSNGNEKQGGTLAKENGAFVYDKFAGYWADSLAAYVKIGITPTWVSLQNEPDWKADWESCLFQPHETTDDKGEAFAGYDKALDAAYRRFQSVPNAPKILGPETLGIGGEKVQNFLGPKEGTTARQVSGIAYHLYYGGDHQKPDTFIPTLRSVRDAYPGKPHWMTEFGRSDGFQTAWIIHNVLTEGNATAYVYWAGLWPGIDTLITIDNPFNPQSTWKLPNGFQPTDRYYGLKHFSAFVSPGYQRVDAATSDPALKVSAFIAPDRSRLVAVLLNTSTTAPAVLNLSTRGFSGQTSTAVYRSVLPPPAVTPTEGERVGVCGPGERFKSLGALPPGGEIALPPQSIVTVVLNKGK
jgi:glucuronoarabinoxylan endo-1,4-beta-xylanase